MFLSISEIPLFVKIEGLYMKVGKLVINGTTVRWYDGTAVRRCYGFTALRHHGIKAPEHEDSWHFEMVIGDW